MKRIALLLALCLGFATPAFAAMDSTALFDTKVLGTDIGKSSTGGVPVGTIIAWPAASNPEDPENWLECNGQAISPSVYLELFAVVGSRVPDMRNQFMRGGTSAEVRQVAADSTRSHAHAMDQHSHTVSGTAGAQAVYVGSQSIAGTAAGQLYDDRTIEAPWNGITVDELAGLPAYTGGNFGVGPGEKLIGGFNLTKVAQASSVTGYTSGGTYHTGGGSISGYTNLAGPTSTHASGSAETAPQHIRVRYLIRALP